MIQLKGEQNPIQSIGVPDAQRIARIWEQRALQMAQVEAEEEDRDSLLVVLVRAGSELLGLEVKYISEVRPMERLTRVPHVPEWIAGVTNLRGQILSVVDLGKYLRLPPAPKAEDGFLVVAQAKSMKAILWVNEICGVEAIPLLDHDSTRPAAVSHSIPAVYVRAIADYRSSTGEQRFVTVLDVDGLFSDPKFIVQRELE